MGRDFARLTEEWVFSGAKDGWALRLTQKKPVVLYRKPLEQNFRIGLALGSRAVEAARARKLPASVLRLSDEAVEYPEGKAIRFGVRGPKDIHVAIQLAAIKLEA